MTDLGPNISLGKVLEVFPDTYTATVTILASSDETFGKIFECKILALRLDNFGAASVSLPMPQDRVYVSTQFSTSFPSIVGYETAPREQTLPTEHQARLTPFTPTTDTTMPTGTNSIRGKAPADVIPGDDFKTGTDGQALAILTGGSVIAKATELCQLLLTKTRATATLVARRLKIFTDFGEIISDSENGSATLAIRGNTQVKKNTSAEAHETDIQLGGKKSLQATLSNKFNLTIDHAGHTAINATSQNTTITQDTNTKIHGSSNLAVDASKKVTIGKHKEEKVKASYNLNIGASSTHMIGGTHSKTVTGPIRTKTHSVSIESIDGIGLAETDPKAKHFDISAGNFQVDIGSLSLKSLPPAILKGKTGNFLVNIMNGDAKIKSLLGDIRLDTVLGDIIADTIKGDVTCSTSAGNATLKTKAGDVTTSTLLGKAELSTVKGDVTTSTLLGKATTSTTLGEAELAGTKVLLEASIRMLSGASSNDPVVTALKLTQQIQSKILSIFNAHTHMYLNTAIPMPTSPPLTQMSPISPTSVSRDIKTMA